MSAEKIINEKNNKFIKREGETLSKVRYLTMTGLMAALITIMTAYICHSKTLSPFAESCLILPLCTMYASPLSSSMPSLTSM